MSGESPLCFARRHMPAAVSAFHAYALAVSRDTGIFFSDARRDAWEFSVSKNTVTAWTQQLEDDGWFVRMDRGPRLKRNRATGMYGSIRYEVLDHDTWVSRHPGKCRYRNENLSQKVGQDSYRSQKLGQEPVPITDEPVPLSDTTCPNLHLPPVPIFGTKQVSSKNRETEQKQESPSAKSAAAVPAPNPIGDPEMLAAFEQARSKVFGGQEKPNPLVSESQKQIQTGITDEQLIAVCGWAGAHARICGLCGSRHRSKEMALTCGRRYVNGLNLDDASWLLANPPRAKRSERDTVPARASG